MNKIFFLTTLFFGFLQTAQAQIYPDSTHQIRMATECDTFLNGLPDGLQQRQATAVRQAIAGDSRALDAIRQGRNTPPELPEAVRTTFISPKLCLFSPRDSSDTLRPLLLYLHGGGWAFGSINSCARFCAAVALAGNCCVAALDYRLAPEFPFPAALDDCCGAFDFLRENAAAWGCDSTRISIGGDSAGGNLALATGLKKPNVYSLVPIYPVTQVFTSPSASWEKYAQGYGCDADLLEAFNAAYAGTQARHPLVSVALAPDADLKRLPRTLVISAGRDVLLDQGTDFVRKLHRLNVNVTHQIFPTATHLFVTVPGQPTAFSLAVKAVSAFIR